MTDDSRADGEGWFYTQGGQRKGPFAADELHKLLAARTIDGEAPDLAQGAGRLAAIAQDKGRCSAQ